MRPEDAVAITKDLQEITTLHAMAPDENSESNTPKERDETLPVGELDIVMYYEQTLFRIAGMTPRAAYERIGKGFAGYNFQMVAADALKFVREHRKCVKPASPPTSLTDQPEATKSEQPTSPSSTTS